MAGSPHNENYSGGLDPLDPNEYRENLQDRTKTPSSDGFTVNLNSLAIRVGELKAVANQVGEIVTTLDLEGGNLGPVDIDAAVAEVADKWRANLGEMRDKIDTIADNVDNAVRNYQAIEQGGEERMRQLAGDTIKDDTIQRLTEQTPAYQENREKERREALGRQNEHKLRQGG
jgi:hypothetical protein